MQAEKTQERKARRALIIEEFNTELDSNSIDHFADEESFEIYLETVRSRAKHIQRCVAVSSCESIQFKVMFPLKLLCGVLSQCQFNGERDLKFRYAFN